MKIPSKERGHQDLRHGHSGVNGFALVATLSLMILLTLVAVGLLTLSSVTLRASSQGESMATARANARMALILAIGELQKTTGTDRAITSPASIVAPANPQGVTGVWIPWAANSDPSSRTRTARNDNFKQWLLSTTDGTPAATLNAPPLVAFNAKDSATLLGTGSLGARANNPTGDQRITLTTTEVKNGKSSGRFAWAVIDESTKARADLYEKNPASKQAAVLRAGAPPIDGVRALAGMEELKPTEADSGRLITLASAGLMPGLDREKLKNYSPDLSVHSASLMTNVVSGGLKRDLSLWFSKGLSAGEKTQKLYKDSTRISDTAPANPPMSLLESYHQYYKFIDRNAGSVTPQAGGVVARLPGRYTSVRNNLANPNVPAEPLMLPSVLRVDVIFSLIARDVHGTRAPALLAARRPYQLHLLYLPVVTLHNPYNLPLSLEGLKVTFKNIPIAFQFLVDGQPLTTSLVPLNQLYSGFESNPGATKDFSCTLASSLTTSGAPAPLVLLPGQTKLFGTPKVPSTWRWQDEGAGVVGRDGVALFDFRNNQTADFNMAPKLSTDPSTGSGFDCDWLIPRPLQTAAGRAVGGAGEGIISLKGNESIGVNYGPFAPAAGAGSFDIKIELKRSGRFSDAGTFSIRYGNEARLKAIVEQGASLRFPTARSFPETFPKNSVDPPITVASLYEKNETPIRDYVNPKPFVIFSVGGRTTKESFVPTRPIADGNPVMNLAKIDLSAGKDPVGGVPLEMVMMPIRGGNAAIEDLRATEEGYAFGGSGSLFGTTRATFYEVPRAPLQSLAQFRHANLAGSGFMPMVTYTAGESRAHPQIGTDKITHRWTDNSVMLDHGWLANEALWDRYFLSTIADQAAVQFSSAQTHQDVMTRFFAGTSDLPNQRFIPHNPGSSTVPAALNGSNAQDSVAAHLLLEGGFNVNSTSENAWIAVLSGLRQADIETHGGLDGGVPGRSAMPRVRRPTAKNIDTEIIPRREQRWEGYRSLSDAEIAILAREIVTEVRARGPFLSLADFVNRGIGSESNPIHLKGALQAAIDRTTINQMADVDGVELNSDQLASRGYQSTRAAEGNTAASAPGSLTQGDILTGLGSRITVRADTFRIRAYGEARDASGKVVLASAWCEAIVQRLPEYVDASDPATLTLTIPVAGAPATTNQTFGRRYQMLAFRWLTSVEV